MGARQGSWRRGLPAADDDPERLFPYRDGLRDPPPQRRRYRQDGLPWSDPLDRGLICLRPLLHHCPVRGAEPPEREARSSSRRQAELAVERHEHLALNLRLAEKEIDASTAPARPYPLMAVPRRPAASSITRGHLRKTLPSLSARAVTISWSCRALTQQIAGGSVIFGGVAEGIGNDQGARDGREHFGRFAWREPFRNELVLTHLEKAFHLLRNRFRQ